MPLALIFHEEIGNKRGRKECKCSCAAMSLSVVICCLHHWTASSSSSSSSSHLNNYAGLDSVCLWLFPPQCRWVSVCVCVCVRADISSPHWYSVEGAPGSRCAFPQDGITERGLCSPGESLLKWVSVRPLDLFSLFPFSFTSNFPVSCFSTSKAFSPLMWFPSCVSHPLSDPPYPPLPPVSLLLSSFHPASISPHLSPPPIETLTGPSSLMDLDQIWIAHFNVLLLPPIPLFASLSLPLFGCAIHPPPSSPPSLFRSLQAPLRILFEFRHTKYVWVSFLSVCVWKDCYFCVCVNHFDSFSSCVCVCVCVSVIQCREGIGVWDWWNRRLWSRSMCLIASVMTAVTCRHTETHTVSRFTRTLYLHSLLIYLLHTNSHLPTSFHTCGCGTLKLTLSTNHTHTHTHTTHTW